MIPDWLFRRNTTKRLKAVLLANAAILERMKEMADNHDAMMQSVDALLAELNSLNSTVSQLAAAKTGAEQSYQDVEAKLEQSRDQVASILQAAQTALGSATTGQNFRPSGQ